MIPGLRRALLWLWSAPGNVLAILLLILMSPMIRGIRGVRGHGYEVNVGGPVGRWFASRNWGDFTASGLFAFLWDMPTPPPWLRRHVNNHKLWATRLGILWLPVYGVVFVALLAWYRSTAKAYRAHPFERWAREAELVGVSPQDPA